MTRRDFTRRAQVETVRQHGADLDSGPKAAAPAWFDVEGLQAYGGSDPVVVTTLADWVLGEREQTAARWAATARRMKATR